ncbi:acyltransferase [Caballeronia sp. GAFFF3]|uniref:acyltransferase family protein n=1 Tax=Caballeronia sp. GAFFF3 TaxID=2921759 RepID=UPI002028B9E7|nr:acyltransferase [Caballeronia sp. GAFFF3]
MLNPLTSLRFFAALLVVIAHIGYGTYHLGGTGVAFFFVLSGFILAYNYGGLYENLEVSSVIRMYGLRLSRIYPMHLVTLMASIPLILSTQFPGIQTLLANITLTQSWYPHGIEIFAFNGVSWTLSVELAFYLLLPFALYVSHKSGLTRTPFRCVTAALGCLCIAVTMKLPFEGWKLQQFTRAWWFLYISPLPHVFIFLTGLFTGLWYNQVKPRVQTSVKAATAFEVAAISAMVMGFLLMHFWAIKFQGGLEICLIPAFAFAISVFAVGRGKISSILSHPLLVLLGEISFSLYMVHQLVFFYLDKYVTQVTDPSGPLTIKFGATLGAVLLAFATFRLIEEPSRVVAKRLVSARKDGRAPRAVSRI